MSNNNLINMLEDLTIFREVLLKDKVKTWYNMILVANNLKMSLVLIVTTHRCDEN